VIKNCFRFAMMAAVILVSAASVHAGIVGSQAFNALSSPNSGSLEQSFSIFDVRTNANQSGDFIGLPTGTLWESFSVGTFASGTVGDVLFISNADFGTFDGVIIGDSGSIAAPFGTGASRQIYATGKWTPGNNVFFGGDISTINADLGLTFVKSSSTSTIGTSLVIDTRAVPEPASAVVLSLALAGMVVRRRRV
jgi:hypothetical protein